jgi:hypothetical protein
MARRFMQRRCGVFETRLLAKTATAIEAAQAEIATALIRSPVADYATYREITGQWRGLKRALEIIEQTKKDNQ